MQHDGQLLDLFARLPANCGSAVFSDVALLRHYIVLDIGPYDHPSLFHGLRIRLATVCLYFVFSF
jgi:hypothetical protein